MAITNHERVGRALALLRDGLAPFVEREIRAAFKDGAERRAAAIVGENLQGNKPIDEYDIAALLKLMWETWNEVFRSSLGPSERNLVNELRAARNTWAHPGKAGISSDDAYRALDSAERLLNAISAPEQASEIEKMRIALLRTRFEEQIRTEKRRQTGQAVETAAGGLLSAWRDIVEPHPDVASGRYQQAEFAADLWQVRIGEGSDEYRNPVEFFRRTYLTESLKHLLRNSVARLTGKGGDPVVQLQTNFGGGKTHSMLALLHLFSGDKTTTMPGVDELLAAEGGSKLPKANVAVLVGNKISPGNPSVKPDGTEVRTLWGELAWQLGGAEGFAMVAADDKHATNPGDRLRELFNRYAPCLILIDEWVAYARQLHDEANLPAGSFDTQFSFAQALTEAAKGAKNTLLVVSLPASDTAASPHAVADDVEVGGERGRQALSRLQNVIGRVESAWRPATSDEGFEIVRRRLFQPLSAEAFPKRDLVVREFMEMYRANRADFPAGCSEAEYEIRFKAAYPIHPEVFDRLYGDWSTLVKFQRTRGVLRLMAAVIHSLWRNDDRNPLIMPCHIPVDDLYVQVEMTRYLSDGWPGVITHDIDGPQSLPRKIDGEVANLGRIQAARRVARTVFLGSAPLPTAANRGIEDRQIRLGCVIPGEQSSIFGDAMRRLAGAAVYLYQDGNRYWYATQPTVTKLAEDRAEQLRANPDKIYETIHWFLRSNLTKTGDFSRIHAMPGGSGDVPDDLDARLVVLRPDAPYERDGRSPAEKVAAEILEQRGNAARIYRNSLVFLAADRARMQDLDEAVRRYLAWTSILDDKGSLDLTAQQTRQAETQAKTAKSTVEARLPETYMWLLVPEQKAGANEKPTWEAMRLTGNDELAVRASKKLKTEERLLTSLGANRLRIELDKIPLWRHPELDHVPFRDLVQHFATYLYLPRLRDPKVLVEAVRKGVASLMWQAETFAWAEGRDSSTGRFVGLVAGVTGGPHDDHDAGLVVRAEHAAVQIEADRAAAAAKTPTAAAATTTAAATSAGASPTKPGSSPPAPQKKRFYGTIELDPIRMGRDMGKVNDEIVAHLTAVPGATVRVSLEIEVTLPDGASDSLVRTVTENARTLKFGQYGFEEE